MTEHRGLDEEYYGNCSVKLNTRKEEAPKQEYTNIN